MLTSACAAFLAVGAAPALGATPAGGSGAASIEPLTAWLEGVSESAQSLSSGDAAAAEIGARAALASSPRGARAARADLALGLALRDAGRFAEAAAALRRAVPSLGDATLQGEARLALADALFYAGHPGAAAALFAEAARSPATSAARARWREADALLEAGAASSAAAAYARLLADHPGDAASPGARLALGTARRAAGDAQGATVAWRALAREEPAEPAGRAASRALAAWRAEGGPVPLATPDERLSRAGRLLDLALPRRVLRALDRLDATAPPPEPASRSALLRALALVQLGRHGEAQPIAERLLADPAATDGTRTGAELVLARTAARARRIDEASARYQRLSRATAPIPGLSPARLRDLPDDAAFLSAWLYFDAGRYARAAELLRAYAREHPRGRRAEDARWFEAWSLVHLGRRGDARRALEHLGRGPLEPQARYWLARLADRGQERALYRRALAAAPPGSWYALLAAGRLAALGERPPTLPASPPSPLPDGVAPGPGGDALARAAALGGAGLPAAALAELRGLAAGREARARAPGIAQLAAALGDAELPFRMARDHLAASRRAQRWLFPLAFPDALPAAARDAGVDPALYLAVMRRESAFRPDARSAAGAVGLVQLIPPTAERLASVNAVSRASVRSLEDPAVSVPLGASYLGLLVERFADPAVVLAAYNAGPAPAAAWAAAREGVPLDAWAEDVPYRETRRYVKNVLADAVAFRALWEGAPLALDGARRIPAPREGVGF
jgi:soluble lytic murein transglycosylase